MYNISKEIKRGGSRVQIHNCFTRRCVETIQLYTRGIHGRRIDFSLLLCRLPYKTRQRRSTRFARVFAISIVYPARNNLNQRLLAIVPCKVASPVSQRRGRFKVRAQSWNAQWRRAPRDTKDGSLC